MDDGMSNLRIFETHDHHAARGKRWQQETCHQHLVQVRHKKMDRTHNVSKKQTKKTWQSP